MDKCCRPILVSAETRSFTLILEPETILNRPVLASSDCIELLDVLFIVVELCSSSRIM